MSSDILVLSDHVFKEFNKDSHILFQFTRLLVVINIIKYAWRSDCNQMSTILTEASTFVQKKGNLSNIHNLRK